MSLGWSASKPHTGRSTAGVAVAGMLASAIRARAAGGNDDAGTEPVARSVMRSARCWSIASRSEAVKAPSTASRWRPSASHQTFTPRARNRARRDWAFMLHVPRRWSLADRVHQGPHHQVQVLETEAAAPLGTARHLEAW